MQTFLITAKDIKDAESHALFLCKTYAINPLDIAIYQSEKSIGIEDIRSIQKKLLLAPLKGEKKALIIHNAHTATTEAQNAMLKILEEPPASASIFLTAEHTYTLLPTVLSRCSVIEIRPKQPQDEEALVHYRKQLQEIRNASASKRLALAQIIGKDRKTALTMLENLILVGRKEMLEEQTLMAIEKLVVLQQAHTILQTTNVNPRFAIEQALLLL